MHPSLAATIDTAAAARAGDGRVASRIVFGLCVELARLSAPLYSFSASSGPGVRAPMALLPAGNTGGARYHSC
jgi:hypothetical protein